MNTNERTEEKIKALWDKGNTMGDIAWMLDISMMEVAEWVNKWNKTIFSNNKESV